MLSGRKLKFLRIYRGMTQKYLADCIGCSVRYVGMVENKNQNISEELYEKWVDALNGKLVPKPKNKEKKKKKEE